MAKMSLTADQIRNLIQPNQDIDKFDDFGKFREFSTTFIKKCFKQIVIIYILVDKVELYTLAEGWYSPEEDVYFSEALVEEKLSSDSEYHLPRGYKARLLLVDT